MKKRWFSSGETSLQILDVLIFSAVATLASGGLSLVIPHVGFLLAVGFGIPLSIFSWGFFTWRDRRDSTGNGTVRSDFLCRCCG
jgi:hypothetical protein